VSKPYEELGVPVRSVNWVRAHAGTSVDGADHVWATMGQQAEGFFVLDVDTRTGACRQVPCQEAKANYPTATCVSKDGILYIGAAYFGHLYAYDGHELTDLGAINSGQATFPCRIDEAPDGKLWIGSYGNADLTCYDPTSKTFERFGSMDDVDMYCYPMSDHRSGLVACLVKVTQQHVVLFNPVTRQKTCVGPSLTKEEGVIDLVRGSDGQLYITTDVGEAYVIDGDTARRRSEVVEVSDPILPGGASFSFSDAHTFLYKELELKGPDGKDRSICLDYKAAGSEIFMLHEGPDRSIYGSSILPLHFFAHDPKTTETVDYGKASESGGEAYSMANLDGKIYISSYPAARISVYDPQLPYGYGEDGTGNPRELGRIDDVSYRPRTTLAGPAGRVWTASLPDYGLWGGPLAWLTPDGADRGSYRDVAGEGSCYTLAHLEEQGLIAIGTTINAGTGTQSRETQARLILWDYESEKSVWDGTPVDGLTTINALLFDSGQLLGTGIGEDLRILFSFDPEERAFTTIDEALPGRPLDHGLRKGPDSIFGVTNASLYRLRSDGIEVMYSEDGLFDVPGPVLDDHLYFATNHLLRRIPLTPLT
jgi:hypothetical protein